MMTGRASRPLSSRDRKRGRGACLAGEIQILAGLPEANLGVASAQSRSFTTPLLGMARTTTERDLGGVSSARLAREAAGSVDDGNGG